MKNRGFTLIELLIALGIGGIISAAIFAAIDPGRRLAEARDSQRWGHVKNIRDAVYQYQIGTQGAALAGVDAQMRQIGTAGAGCAIPCFFGEESGVTNTFIDDTQTEFDAGVYANTQWIASALSLSSLPIGTYTSRIFNAGTTTPWTTLSWVPRAPYGKPLPNGGQSETGYASANAGMSGNGALWHLDEGSGQITDSSGNGRHSTVQSGIVYGASGVYGSALTFNGSAYADFPSIFPYSPHAADITELTAELWMRSSVNPASAGVMAWQGWGGTYVLQVNAQGQISFVVKQTKNSCTHYDGAWIGANSSPDAYTNGQWHHVAGRYHRAENTIQLYVDGMLKNTATLNANECLSDPTTTHPPILGAASQYPNNRVNFYTGNLDEVALYGRALSADEIRERYERGASNIRVQVRSCENFQCNGSNFVGPNGTANDYYDETMNAALAPPSLPVTNIPAGRYAQYRMTFSASGGVPLPSVVSATVSNAASGSALLPDACVDITPALARYLPVMPRDMSIGTPERSGYAIGTTAGGAFIVRACNPEREEIIEAR
ncbi:prepilin-type N-terminal cleavage/methylation domain-containing protein [Candidatus Uhrbacteria bacterium]|nr:prepilin-type N-terminal cleavage/methylation domain-containing protein [Candidatus Uhrbacteria bacterium]